MGDFDNIDGLPKRTCAHCVRHEDSTIAAWVCIRLPGHDGPHSNGNVYWADADGGHDDE